MTTIKHSYNGFIYLLDNNLQKNGLLVPLIYSDKYPDKPLVLYHYYNMSLYSVDSLLQLY
jgi:hypothetical protein